MVGVAVSISVVCAYNNNILSSLIITHGTAVDPIVCDSTTATKCSLYCT